MRVEKLGCLQRWESGARVAENATLLCREIGAWRATGLNQRAVVATGAPTTARGAWAQVEAAHLGVGEVWVRLLVWGFIL